MSTLKDHTPAMPGKASDDHYSGLTAREYAAIKLRVPESGSPWLDAMIRKSLRDELAAKVLPAAYGNSEEFSNFCRESGTENALGFTGEQAYRLADAMLRARDA